MVSCGKKLIKMAQVWQRHIDLRNCAGWFKRCAARRLTLTQTFRTLDNQIHCQAFFRLTALDGLGDTLDRVFNEQLQYTNELPCPRHRSVLFFERLA